MINKTKPRSVRNALEKLEKWEAGNHHYVKDECVKERGCHVDNIMKRHMGGDSKIQTPFIIAELRCRVHA